MKKAYIVAYFQKNIGDDLFVLSLVRRYPEASFTCNCNPVYYQAFSQEKNLKGNAKVWFLAQRIFNKLHMPKNIAHRIAAKGKDAFIRIGGSIFMEQPGWKPDSKAVIADNQFVVGANFGPYTTQTFLDDVHNLFANCRDVCLRDTYSYEFFTDLDNVRYAPDVLFGYPDYPEYKKGMGVGISVFPAHLRQSLAKNAENYYQVVAESCDVLIEKGMPVKLFAFCENEGDVLAAKQVLKKTKNSDKIKLCVYDGDVDTFLQEINSCEYMIATRFHAMILAWAMGKKVVPVTYSRKQTHVLEDLRYEGDVWDLLGGNMLDAQSLVDACLRAEHTLDIAKLKADAQRQFAGLDAYFNSQR